MLRKLVLEMKRCVKLIMTAWRGWMEREVQREADSFGESRALRHVSAPLPTRPHAPPPHRLCAASGLRSRRRPPSNPIGCAGVSCWGPGRREREMLLNKSCCRIHFSITIRFNDTRKRPTFRQRVGVSRLLSCCGSRRIWRAGGAGAGTRWGVRPLTCPHARALAGCRRRGCPQKYLKRIRTLFRLKLLCKLSSSCVTDRNKLVL